MFEEVSLNRDEWRNSSTSKPSKLVTVTGCRESMGKWHHDMPQHSAILRSPSHTPGLGPLVTDPVVSQIDARDGGVCLQRLGQGLETETDQGWRLHPGLYRSNRDHWNPENTWHLTHDIYLRHSRWYKIWKNNPEIHNFIQDISCWQMSFKHSIHSHQTQCRNLDPWVLYEEGFGYWAQLNTENKAQCFSKKRHCPFFWNLLFSFFSYLPGEGSLDFYKSATSPPLSSPAARPLLLCLPLLSAFRQLPELTNASSSGIISIAPETFGELHGSLGTHGPEACGEPEIRLRTHGPEQMTQRMSGRLSEFIPHGIPERNAREECQNRWQKGREIEC